MRLLWLLLLFLACRICRLSSQTPPEKQRLSKPQRDTRPRRTPEVFSVKFKQKLKHLLPPHAHIHTNTHTFCSLPLKEDKLWANQKCCKAEKKKPKKMMLAMTKDGYTYWSMRCVFYTDIKVMPLSGIGMKGCFLYSSKSGMVLSSIGTE